MKWWIGAWLWREGIFAEIFCLGLWMNSLGSFQNSAWHQSNADSSWPYTKNTAGNWELCPPPPFLHHPLPFSARLQPWKPKILTGYLDHLLTLAGHRGRWQSRPSSMVVKTSKRKPLQIKLRCHHCLCCIHLVLIIWLSHVDMESLYLSVAGIEKRLSKHCWIKVVMQGVLWRTIFLYVFLKEPSLTPSQTRLGVHGSWSFPLGCSCLPHIKG